MSKEEIVKRTAIILVALVLFFLTVSLVGCSKANQTDVEYQGPTIRFSNRNLGDNEGPDARHGYGLHPVR